MNKRNSKRSSRTNWKRIDAMKDKEIDYSDVPSLDDEFFKHAEIKLPNNKEVVTIRLDKDVVNWFRSKGRGYQTRINALLRRYMETQQDKRG